MAWRMKYQTQTDFVHVGNEKKPGFIVECNYAVM